MQAFFNFVVANRVVEITGLFIASELLAVIPSVKANSIFQLVFGWLKKQQAPAEVAPPAA